MSLHQEVETWYLSLCERDPETADLIEQAIDQLAAEGPYAEHLRVLEAGRR